MNCLICKEQFAEAIELKCGHTYCNNCFTTWYKSNKRVCCYCSASFEYYDYVEPPILEQFREACVTCDKNLLSVLIRSFASYGKANKSCRFNEAVKCGNLETLKYLKEIDFFYPDWLTTLAFISTGNLDVIKWGIANNAVRFDEVSFENAIKFNLDLETLTTLLDVFNVSIGINALCYAITREDLALLEFLKRRNAPESPMIRRFARATGNVSIIKWVDDNYNYKR